MSIFDCVQNAWHISKGELSQGVLLRKRKGPKCNTNNTYCFADNRGYS